MQNEVYRRLARALDTLPNGFPAAEDGLELRVLEKIFTPEEADLFCDLRLALETVEQIAERTGRPLAGLEETLTRMWLQKGQILGVQLGPMRLFCMLPWFPGMWEMQAHRGHMDEELARLCSEYHAYFGREIGKGPKVMRTIPLDQEVSADQEVLSYDRVAGIIENSGTILLNDCACRKEEQLLGRGCEHPLDVCLTLVPVPGAFEDGTLGRPISKEEAYAVLDRAEAAGLIHLTTNVESGQYFLCNCCGCCCAGLKAITKLGLTDVINSDYYSLIDHEACTECGLCAENVCQLDAIAEREGGYRVDRARCVGCGQCLMLCPADAIRLLRKPAAERVQPPATPDLWREERARARGVDFSRYK
jgi:Pyruvate/2-oxoacid:ferredoxin oxidoreductase delta subunit